MFTEILIGLMLAVGAVVVIMLLRAAFINSRQMPATDAAVPESCNGFDADEAARRLSGAIKAQTVNSGGAEDASGGEFIALHEHLKSSYPSVFSTLEASFHNNYSLLLKWKGSDGTAEPILLMGHMDVVPVEQSTADKWVHPPFSGDIADGFVWGRGALDCKHVVCGLLEAAECLIKEGFTPKRDIYYAFGHDEETGGSKGAASIARYLEEQGIRIWMILDEGGNVNTPGTLTSSNSESVVSISEKGYASFRLEVDMPGGHSSRPPSDNALNVLVRAASRVNSHNFRANMRGPVSEMLGFAASEMGFWGRLLLANRWLTEPIVVGILSSNPNTRSLIRTTAVVTIITAGLKDNVIPSHAEAVVNTRPEFGSTPEGVMKELVQVINDERVKIIPIGSQIEPSKVTSLTGEQFKLLHKIIVRHFTDTVIIPCILTGGTDTKHYSGLSESIFRFVPVQLPRELLAGIHGINERIPVEEIGRMVGFYCDLLRVSAS